MSDSAATATTESSAADRRPAAGGGLRLLLAPLASLRLTVVLFAFSVFLVFAGTLAQIDDGIWTVVTRYFRSFLVWIPFQIFFPRAWTVPGGIPYPGGWTLGLLLMVNLLAAHAVRFRLAWSRAGILLTHAGMMILLASEFVTGLLAVEGNMTIDEGSSSNYVEHTHAFELAVVDPSDPDRDAVTAVPASLLRRGGRIAHPALPFDVAVEGYMVNSRLGEAGRDSNPATAGEGLRAVAIPRPEISGTDAEQSVDMPSAYVALRRKGTDEAMGTWLMSLWLNPQTIEADGKRYQVSLRFRRTYKPYALHLLDFEHKRYVGTNTPKDYASTVRVVDPGRGVDREVRIWMNHPLRYEGETFYQSSFKPGDTGTILQVVRNPGWLLPYLSCGLVSVGLLWHFGANLAGFLRRGVRSDRPAAAAAASAIPAGRAAWATWAAAAAAAAYIGAGFVPAGDPPGGLRLREFGRIPVVYQGRTQPLDTLARNSLMVISGRQTWEDGAGRRQPAVRWLLDVMTSRLATTPSAEKHRVFRIENDQVLALLGLAERPGLRYAVEEFIPRIEKLETEAGRAHRLEADRRDLFDGKILELAEHVQLYIGLAGWTLPHAVPDAEAPDGWTTLYDAAKTSRATGRIIPAARTYTAILDAYAKGETEKFNEAVAAHGSAVDGRTDGAAGLARLETVFNGLEPFHRCAVLYGVVFLLSVIGWLGWGPVMNRAALGVAYPAILLHTAGILGRMLIQGRPPVTNLYSSAVFIGWVCLLLAVFLERVFRNGIGTTVAGLLGIPTMVIAHHLAAGGDTLQMMQAVLDTNFWLATHVVCITIGYAGTFLAGALAMLLLLRGVLTRSLGRELFLSISRMTYGVLCFALLFSFVGTVLGGIWADQSWGRFWGWDPKENGAAIIVGWNALVLHARWGGMIRQRGMAVLAVFGNIVTAWSWFGVNMLGVGLHSYGFMESAAFWLAVFVGSQLAIIGLGFTPLSSWRSAASIRADAPSNPGAPPPVPAGGLPPRPV